MKVRTLIEILSRVSDQDVPVKYWGYSDAGIEDIDVRVVHDPETGHLTEVSIHPAPIKDVLDAAKKLNEELNRLNKPVDFKELAEICEELGFEVITFDEEPPEHVN